MSSSNIHPPGYDFDTAETAEYIGISTATLGQWATKKINLPYVLIGNKRWYRQDDVDLYILSRTVKIEPLSQDAAA